MTHLITRTGTKVTTIPGKKFDYCVYRESHGGFYVDVKLKNGTIHYVTKNYFKSLADATKWIRDFESKQTKSSDPFRGLVY